MDSTDILIRANGFEKSFSVFLALDEHGLSREQLVEIQIRAQILQQYVLKKLGNSCGQTNYPSPNIADHHDRTTVRGKRKSSKPPSELL